MTAHVLEVVFELVDATLDATAVDFELRFARTARADATGLLREPGARTAQPRQAVAQLRQFDLRLALLAVRVLGEDVEDHRGAIERGAAEQLLEIELLRRSELVVEDDGVAVEHLRRAHGSRALCLCRRTSRGRAHRAAG